MQVSSNGYYYWKNAPVSKRNKQNDYILLQIIRSFKDSRKLYGSPRIYENLRANGIKCSVNKVPKLMKNFGISAVTSVRHKKAQAAKNTKGFALNVLDRKFCAEEPNQTWVSDTTFIRTSQGWLYLAAAIDLYSAR